VYRPFRFGKVEVFPNARGVYVIGENLVVAVEPRNAVPGSRVHFEVVGSEPSGKTWVEKTVEAVGLDSGPMVHELSLAGIEGGRFELVATLFDAEGMERDRRTAAFTVSPRTSIVRPAVRGSIAPPRPEVPGVVAMILGEQYLRMDEKEKARAQLERAIRENPQLGPARELLAGLLLDGGEIDGVFAVLEPLAQNAPDRFEILSILGQAYFHQKQYAKSIEILEKAITLRRPEPQLLNVLALAHHELGNDARAKEILERSLSLNPEQLPVKDLLEKLKAGTTGPR
jgi:tetratricopeptide (TPR) repeat protein